MDVLANNLTEISLFLIRDDLDLIYLVFKSFYNKYMKTFKVTNVLLYLFHLFCDRLPYLFRLSHKYHVGYLFGL